MSFGQPSANPLKHVKVLFGVNLRRGFVHEFPEQRPFAMGLSICGTPNETLRLLGCQFRRCDVVSEAQPTRAAAQTSTHNNTTAGKTTFLPCLVASRSILPLAWSLRFPVPKASGSSERNWHGVKFRLQGPSFVKHSIYSMLFQSGTPCWPTGAPPLKGQPPEKVPPPGKVLQHVAVIKDNFSNVNE